MVEVTFLYDEQSRKWDPVVRGAVDSVEARQAFAAVVLSCQRLQSQLLALAKTEQAESGIRIIPAV